MGTPEGTAESFETAFARLALDLDPSSKNPQKNKPLERLLAERTGWPSVAVKYIGDQNNLTNRLGETQKTNDPSPNLLLLVPEKILAAARGVAERNIAAGRFDVICIATRDREPPVVTDFVHRIDIPIPQALLSAFPDAGVADTKVESKFLANLTPREGDDESAYSIAECAEDIGIPESTLEDWLRRLERKKQLIFQGPPGTGKTFVAKHIARLLTANAPESIETVQFHPSYSYEDFVQGIRARVGSAGLEYVLTPGRFLNFCQRAREHSDRPFVLVIDELNRGNLSRIFGELQFLLEYRGEAIPLAQGGEPFSIPENVHIIATMNTADRSIALVDHALRRRFSFVFLGPDYEYLESWLKRFDMDDGGQLVATLRRINQAIEDRNYHLGTSFFLTPRDALRTCLKEIWEGEVEPYLDEYFFDQPSKVDDFRWSRLSGSGLRWWVNAAVPGTSQP